MWLWMKYNTDFLPIRGCQWTFRVADESSKELFCGSNWVRTPQKKAKIENSGFSWIGSESRLHSRKVHQELKKKRKEEKRCRNSWKRGRKRRPRLRGGSKDLYWWVLLNMSWTAGGSLGFEARRDAFRSSSRSAPLEPCQKSSTQFFSCSLFFSFSLSLARWR